MDAAVAASVVSAVTAFLALIVSVVVAVLALRQMRLVAKQVELNAAQVEVTNRGLQLDPLYKMLSVFREPEFFWNYQYLLDTLPKGPDGNRRGLRSDGNDPALGVAGVSDTARKAFLDVCHHYQTLSFLALADVVPRGLVLSVLRRRLPSVWNAVEEYVLAERKIRPHTERDYLKILEVTAREAGKLSEDSLNDLVLQMARSATVLPGVAKLD